MGIMRFVIGILTFIISVWILKLILGIVGFVLHLLWLAIVVGFLMLAGYVVYKILAPRHTVES